MTTFTAQHSLSTHTTKLHHYLCTVVCSKRRGFVMQRLDAQTLDDAKREAIDETGRTLTVCKCALDYVAAQATDKLLRDAAISDLLDAELRQRDLVKGLEVRLDRFLAEGPITRARATQVNDALRLAIMRLNSIRRQLAALVPLGKKAQRVDGVVEIVNI